MADDIDAFNPFEDEKGDVGKEDTILPHVSSLKQEEFYCSPLANA